MNELALDSIAKSLEHIAGTLAKIEAAISPGEAGPLFAPKGQTVEQKAATLGSFTIDEPLHTRAHHRFEERIDLPHNRISAGFNPV